MSALSQKRHALLIRSLRPQRSAGVALRRRVGQAIWSEFSLFKVMSGHSKFVCCPNIRYTANHGSEYRRRKQKCWHCVRYAGHGYTLSYFVICRAAWQLGSAAN